MLSRRSRPDGRTRTGIARRLRTEAPDSSTTSAGVDGIRVTIEERVGRLTTTVTALLETIRLAD